MAARMIDLAGYLERSADLPWAWGKTDCTLWVADWCLMRWGYDPASAYRGRYSTQAEAEALMAAGLVETIRPHMGFVGEKTVPEDGDVGVIAVDGKQVSAIRFGDLWAFRHPEGIVFQDAPALAVWGD